MGESASDRKNRETDERRAKTCLHFTGVYKDICKAGVEYRTFVISNLPCLAKCPGQCNKYEPTGAERVAESNAKFKRQLDLNNRGLSSCCEAPLDKSMVITSGRYKGHGPRYCSKCHNLEFIV